MANPGQALAGNVEGNFFVDDTCIDCDLCRQIAPMTFAQVGGASIVQAQPHDQSEIHCTAQALVACPTGSIGTRDKTDLREASRSYPELIHDNVYFCGFASRHSFGGKSYFIVHPDGNILVDSPRFASALVRKFEELGGIKTMFLTHRDDVADHEKFHRHFGCERVIHHDESGRIEAERYLTGSGSVELAPDVTAIPTPGHTRGHVVLLYRNQFLFTGDHLAWSDHYDHLIAFRRHNWYSWPETIRSMERLIDYRFEWVLPGHGRRAHFPAEVMRVQVSDCVEWMRGVA